MVGLENSDKILKVSSNTNPQSLSGAIVGIIRKGPDNCQDLELRAIGAGAVNNAIKAIVIANGWLAPSGKIIHISPSFDECPYQNGDNVEQRTLVRLRLVIVNI